MPSQKMWMLSKVVCNLILWVCDIRFLWLNHRGHYQSSTNCASVTRVGVLWGCRNVDKVCFPVGEEYVCSMRVGYDKDRGGRGQAVRQTPTCLFDRMEWKLSPHSIQPRRFLSSVSIQTEISECSDINVESDILTTLQAGAQSRVSWSALGHNFMNMLYFVRRADNLSAMCEPTVCLDNVGSSISRNLIGLHGLLQG
jgi:hypothetical protein